MTSRISILAVAIVALLASGPAAAQTAPPKPGERTDSPPREKKPSKPAQTDKTSELAKKPKDATKSDKASLLTDLYGRLARAGSDQEAETLAALIEQVWAWSTSDTVLLLMERSAAAVNEKKHEDALQILDGIVTLQPDYAEAFNRRAYVSFLEKDFAGAISDLKQVLALDRRHFKALGGLATVLREIGDKRGALMVYRQLLSVNPHSTDAKDGIKELEPEVEGLKI